MILQIGIPRKNDFLMKTLKIALFEQGNVLTINLASIYWFHEKFKRLQKE